MSTALHLKLTIDNYFKGYRVDVIYFRAAANNSDGFKLAYRILDIIHPQLRASKRGLHKSIEPPTYEGVDNDSIYTFMTKCKG